MLDNYISITILGICLCVGYVIKHCLVNIPNRYIPLILSILGVVLSVLNANSFSIDAILIGLVSGLASTGSHQLGTNLFSFDKEYIAKIKAHDELVANEESEDIDKFKKEFYKKLDQEDILSADVNNDDLIKINSINNDPVITKKYLTKNKYSRPGNKRSRTTKIAWHFTGGAKVPAINTWRYFENLKNGYKVNGRYVYASSQYIVGLDGEIYQLMDDSEIAYTTNSANAYSIGIECSHIDDYGKFSEATYRSMVWLGAKLAKERKLNPKQDFIRHYDVTGKLCPLWFVKHTSDWNKFKQDCYDVLKGKDLDDVIKPKTNTDDTQLQNKVNYNFETTCVVTNTDDYLNVRNRRPIDGVLGNLLFIVPVGEKVKVGYVMDGWAYIEYNNKYGFVNIKFLEIVK